VEPTQDVVRPPPAFAGSDWSFCDREPGRVEPIIVSTCFQKITPVAVRIAVGERRATTTIELEGEFDLVDQEAVRSTVVEALARRPDRLVLDLSRLSFIDCSGVHVVIEATEHSVQQDTRLMIVPGPSVVHRVFEMCQLTAVLPFVPCP
jgi:anti-sigma B factor antagonist